MTGYRPPSAEEAERWIDERGLRDTVREVVAGFDPTLPASVVDLLREARRQRRAESAHIVAGADDVPAGR